MILPEAAKAEFSCLDRGRVREIRSGKPVEHEARYCLHHALHDVISLDCIETDKTKKACEAVARYRANKTPLRPANSRTGNPFHRRCLEIGGKPGLHEVLDGSEWIRAGLCTFADGSFISVENRL